MTFTEAALEVLRTAGEPLHYKKITELAIERNLLSHVGKTPEVTMSSRLAMMVKKDRGQAPIIKVKPGVFAIRESALQGTSLSPEALAAISEVEGGVEGLGESKAIEVGAVGAQVTVSEESASIAPPALPVPKAPLPGSDVFPEEEGDDDPILAGLEQESEGGERSGRRRRRRRRRKGDKPEAGSEASSPRSENNSNNNQRERFRDRSRQDRPERSERPERPERQDRQERFERDRQERRGDERRGDERNESRSESAEGNLDWNRQPADGDLLGKDLADAVSAVMARGDRTPHTFARVAELLVRRGRLSGAPAALAPTIAAAVRADIARSELQRARPRFRLRAGRLLLSDWHLPKGLQRAEQDLLSGAERYASEMRRALIQKLSELPTAGFAELLATWLNAEGVTALRAVRRPGSSGSELHFAGTRKTGSEEVRLAIVVQRGSRDIDREGVIDVRGALHHYGQAQAAWIVTLGRITSGAREEAGAQAAACALFDGNALVAAMERLGVAVRRNVIMHHEIDYELLESLGDSPEQRERREREQERERREYNERSRAAQQQRSRSGRAPSAQPSGRDQRDELDEDEPSAVAARPVKLRDADWDDDAAHDHSEASEGDGFREAPAPRAFALHDAEDEESASLRDELESDSDESADDEDFSTSEETDSDDEFAARDSDEDLDDNRHENSDESDDSDDSDDSDNDVDAAESDEDYRAGLEDEGDNDDADESDDSDDADDAENDDTDESDDAEDSDDNESEEHESDDEQERGETAERGRRR